MQCTIPDCTEYATGDSVPPLCWLHLDLDCLVEFALSRKEEITVPTIQAHFQMARTNSSLWVITPTQIAEMLPAYLEIKKVGSPHHEAADRLTPTQR